MKSLRKLIGVKAFSISELLEEIQSNKVRELKYDFLHIGPLLSELMRRNALLTEGSHVINVACSSCSLITLKKLENMGLQIDVNFNDSTPEIPLRYLQYYNAVESALLGRNYDVFKYLAKNYNLSRYRNINYDTNNSTKPSKKTYWFEFILNIPKITWDEAKKFFDILIFNGYKPLQNENFDPIIASVKKYSRYRVFDLNFVLKSIKFFCDLGLKPCTKIEHRGVFEELTIGAYVNFTNIPEETKYLKGLATLIIFLQQIGADPIRLSTNHHYNETEKRTVLTIYDSFCDALESALSSADEELKKDPKFHKVELEPHITVLNSYLPIYYAMKTLGFDCKSAPVYQNYNRRFGFAPIKTAYDTYENAVKEHKLMFDLSVL